MDSTQKDPNVMAFMTQMVQEKHGDNIDSKFLEEEADRLYNEFGDNLVNYFEPMLSDTQKAEFDKLVSGGATQDKLLEFLMSAIDNLEQKILTVLTQFKTQYMSR